MKPSAPELHNLYVEQHQSTHEMARRYDVSQMTIRRWMKGAGIDARSYHENPHPATKGGTHSWGSKISASTKGNPRVGQGNAGKRGADAPNWKGGLKTETNGRISKWDPDRKRYIPNAVTIWLENHPGETVGRGFVIHHRDSDPSNDVPSNLIRLSNAEHLRVHRRRDREYREELQRIILELGGTYPPYHDET